MSHSPLTTPTPETNDPKASLEITTDLLTSTSLSSPRPLGNNRKSVSISNSSQDSYKSSPLRHVMFTSMTEDEVIDSGDDEVVEEEEEDDDDDDDDDEGEEGEEDEEEDVQSMTRDLLQKAESFDLQKAYTQTWRTELDRERLIRSGWLEKKSEHRKKWNRRWFVLRASRLTYYKDENEYSALSILPLPEIHSVCPTQIKSRQHILTVVTRKRIYYLDAMIESELNQWIQSFQSLLEPLYTIPSSNLMLLSPNKSYKRQQTADLASSSLMDPLDSSKLIEKETTYRSGYLWRLEKGKLGKHWKKRWCVLKEDRFMCYKDEREYTPLKIIYLDALLDTLTIPCPKSLEKHLPLPIHTNTNTTLMSPTVVLPISSTTPTQSHLDPTSSLLVSTSSSSSSTFSSSSFTSTIPSASSITSSTALPLPSMSHSNTSLPSTSLSTSPTSTFTTPLAPPSSLNSNSTTLINSNPSSPSIHSPTLTSTTITTNPTSVPLSTASTTTHTTSTTTTHVNTNLSNTANTHNNNSTLMNTTHSLAAKLDTTTTFQMVTTGKSFYFASDTRDDMCVWVFHIRKFSNAPTTTATPSIHCLAVTDVVEKEREKEKEEK